MAVKKSKRVVKKSSAKKLGDANQDVLEKATIEACQAKLQSLQADYAAGTFLENDAVAHLGKEVKIAHWIRSLLNQTIN